MQTRLGDGFGNCLFVHRRLKRGFTTRLKVIVRQTRGITYQSTTPITWFKRNTKGPRGFQMSAPAAALNRRLGQDLAGQRQGDRAGEAQRRVVERVGGAGDRDERAFDARHQEGNDGRRHIDLTVGEVLDQ